LGATRVPKTGDTGTSVKLLAGLFFLVVSAATLTVVVVKNKEEEEN
jgi:LPXTG-motif cell wall-anchored protein